MIYHEVLCLKKQNQTKNNLGESDEVVVRFLINYFFLISLCFWGFYLLMIIVPTMLA